MYGQNKEDDASAVCKSHSARQDKELYRVCPSKLSKRELEDLYFTLLENNLELKKVNNIQQDKIKLLSTKVQRITATQRTLGKDQKDCCANTKALVNEHKESIADLKRANERMSERIRVLNMRLCSAKQFLRRSPPACNSKCTKCSILNARASNMSMLNTKRSETNFKTSVSSQCLDKDAPIQNVAHNILDESYKWFTGLVNYMATSTAATTTTDNDKESPQKLCDENKCRTQIEELKQKIVELQEELFKTHEEYTVRVTRLEEDIARVQSDNQRLRNEQAAADYQLQQRLLDEEALGQRLRAAEAKQSEYSDNQRLRNEQAAADYQLQQRLLDEEALGQRLRAAKAKQSELETQLTIEKRKVTELETSVRAADMTRNVAATIERHLSNTSQMKTLENKPQLESISSPYLTPRLDRSPSRQIKTQDDKLQLESISSPYFTPRLDRSPSRIETPTSRCQDGCNKTDPKVSDDSGYMEANKSREEDKNKDLNRMNMDILGRISLFQDQMEDLKIVAAGNSTPTTKPYDSPNRTASPQFSGEPNNAISIATQEPKKRISEDRNSIMTAKSVESRILFKKTLEQIHKDQEIANEEKRHFAQTKKCQEIDSDLEIETSRKKQYQRSDNHNSLQIPGPLPVDTVVTEPPIKRKEKSVAAKFKQLLDRPKSRKSITKNIYSDASTSQNKDNAVKDSLTDSVTMESEWNDKSENDKKDDQTFTSSIQTDIERKAPNNKLTFSDIGQNVDAINEEKAEESKQAQTQRNAAVETDDDVPEKGPDLGTQTYEFEEDIQEQAAGPSRKQADIGTSTFDAPSPTNARATTAAPYKHRRNSATPFNAQPPTSAPFTAHNRGTTPFADPAITAPYERPAPEPTPVAPLSHRSRGTSPDNTDAEISSMTDLPSEKDSKSPRARLSPGEDKATTTYTDSYTQPETDYGSLSEGELPSPIKDKKLSTVETKVNFAINDPVSQRMEEALQAVSLELARCRELLRTERPSQAQRRLTTREVGLMTDFNGNQGAPLKRKPATPSIGDAFAPKCIFTLHIGTVVLSDEAVINSRNMSLMLMWKFYDNELAMTRLRAGRVVLFDFSTEYDVKITPEFINYLKHEEMPLLICELDQQGNPFATCSLPLRDALLHANRRADMSLALDIRDIEQNEFVFLIPKASLLHFLRTRLLKSSVLPYNYVDNIFTKIIAGPKLRHVRATRDSLDSSDEVGVLDLWCSLRVDPAVLPSVNQAFGKTITPPSTARPSENTSLYSNMNSVNQKTDAAVDDVSADCLFGPGFGGAAARHRKSSTLYDLDKLSRTPVTTQRSVASQSASEFYKSHYGKDSTSSPQNKIPRNSSRTSFFKKESALPQNSQQKQAIVHPIIKNEVPVTIKSASDLKKVLNEVPTLSSSRVSRLTEDNTSQTHSTINAWRGLVSRQLIPKAERRSDRLSSIVAETKPNSEKKEDRFWSKFNKYTSPSANILRARSPMSSVEAEQPPELTKSLAGSYRMLNSSKRSALSKDENYQPGLGADNRHREIQVTILWLALNEECDAMTNPRVQRLYVSYEFMGRIGADMETPTSLPKPKGYADKCTFNFSKTFHLNDSDIPIVGHMARCRSNGKTTHKPKDCIVFTVISEPLEDPLGLENCQDIGYAYLYLGDLLAYSGGNSSFTEVVPVRSARAAEPACGVLALRLDGLDVVRRCLLLALSDSVLKIN